MKQLLIISLLFAFNSAIAQQSHKEKKTYLDSLECAFDNTCFLVDSLENELGFLILINSICEAENDSRNKLILNLRSEIDLLKQQKANLSEIISAKEKDIAESKKALKKAKRKGILDSVGYGVGGFGLGGIITFFAVFFNK